MRLFSILLLFFLTTATAFAVETRGLRVVAKDPASGQSSEVTLYNKSYAVIIGIDRYQNLPQDRQLKNAVGDAKGIEAVLRKNYRFDRIFTLQNEQATRDNIMKLLTSELPKTIGRDDALFVFWAGHGNQEKTDDGDLGYLIPFDGNSHGIYGNITMSQLRDDISKAIPAKHIFYAFDACYGGLLTETRSVDRQSRRDLSYLKEITRERVRQVLTAGGKNQEALDGGPKGHSVFTGRLIEALEAAGDFITANEIQTILKEKVYNDAKGRGHTQTPAFGALSGNGDFVFIPNIEQKVQDNRAQIDRIQAEMKLLETMENASREQQNEQQRKQLEQERRVIEAKLKAAQLREQQLAREEQQRLDAERERQRLTRQKSEDEKTLAKVKAEVEKKRQQVQGLARTDTLEAAVAEIKRLSVRIDEIETTFARELDTTRKQVSDRYAIKLTELDKQQKDEFESNSEFSASIDKEKAALQQQRDAEQAALTPQNAAAKETGPLKEAIRKLSDKEFTVGADYIAMELSQYDADKELFPVNLKSKSELVHLSMNGTIPLPKDRAKSFKQQYTAGAIQPVVTVKTGTGETAQVALVNDTDSSKLMFADGSFMTAIDRKLAQQELAAERERLIYTDPSTGLQWVRNGNLAERDMNWQKAMDWVQNLIHAGYNDWRLPTKEELVSFAKRGGLSPAEHFNANGFNNVHGGWYWASPTGESKDHDAWGVHMNDGYVSNLSKDSNYCVWPVREWQ